MRTRVLVAILAGFYGLVLFGAFWVCSDRAQAHSGGTDSNGGHYNRKTGQYHYHGGTKNKSRDVDADYDYTPPAKPKSSVYRGTAGGKQVVRCSSSQGEDSGVFELTASAPAHDGSRTYKAVYKAEGADTACAVNYDLTREELIECLEAMCAMLEELKAEE